MSVLFALALVIGVLASVVGISMAEWGQLNSQEALIFGAIGGFAVALGYYAGSRDEDRRRRTSQDRERIRR